MSEGMLMSRIAKLRRSNGAFNLAAAAMLGLTSLGLADSAHAQVHHGVHGTLPATPCPCAADGMCYPRRETWGNYKTHWRAWPGETVGLSPTPADGGTPGMKEQLPPYMRPSVDQEDLRGPVKPIRPAAPAADGAAAAVEAGLPPLNGGAQPAQPGGAAPGGAPAAAPAEEGEEAAPPANDALELPGFGPQGSLQPLPQLEEGPPALPAGLSQALSAQPGTAVNLTQQPMQRPTVAANPSAVVRPVINAVPSNSRYVTPAAAIDTSHIELANPAAKNVQKSMEQDLEQAIYFEASDMSPGQ